MKQQETYHPSLHRRSLRWKVKLLITLVRCGNHNAIIIWLVVSTPLKNMKVSWDDYSQYMGKSVPNHQPVVYIYKHSKKKIIPKDQPWEVAVDHKSEYFFNAKNHRLAMGWCLLLRTSHWFPNHKKTVGWFPHYKGMTQKLHKMPCHAGHSSNILSSTLSNLYMLNQSHTSQSQTWTIPYHTSFGHGGSHEPSKTTRWCSLVGFC